MIRQIFSAEELDAAAEKLEFDIFGGKILALASGYGFSYPFARFFAAENALICDYYGEGVLWGNADEECAEFILAAGFKSLLMSRGNYEKNFLGQPAAFYRVMSREGGGDREDDLRLRTDTPYDEVFGIMSDGFKMRFDDWYPDACHMIRHGVSKIYTLDGAAAVQQMFTKNGITLFSLVSVKKERRGEGLGKRLITAAANRCTKSRVYVICEPDLSGFYETCGFSEAGEAVSVKLKKQPERIILT